MLIKQGQHLLSSTPGGLHAPGHDPRKDGEWCKGSPFYLHFPAVLQLAILQLVQSVLVPPCLQLNSPVNTVPALLMFELSSQRG